jgi:hypothetical protein
VRINQKETDEQAQKNISIKEEVIEKYRSNKSARVDLVCRDSYSAITEECDE